MKRIILTILFLISITTLISCVKEYPTIPTERNVVINSQNFSVENASNDASNDVTTLTKSFYEEYFAQEKENDEAVGRMGNAERMEVVKRKYLTENLIEELHLRSRQNSCDAITNSQDNLALDGKLTYKNGKDKNTALVTYRFDNQNGYDETTIELHFIDVNGQKLANELNTTCVMVENGKEINRYEYKTKWANKPNFSEADIKEMESIKESLDKNEAEGFID